MPRRNSAALKPRTRLRGGPTHVVINTASNEIVFTGTKADAKSFAHSWAGNLIVKPIDIYASAR